MVRLVFLHIDSETGNKLFSGESEQDYKKKKQWLKGNE